MMTVKKHNGKRILKIRKTCNFLAKIAHFSPKNVEKNLLLSLDEQVSLIDIE